MAKEWHQLPWVVSRLDADKYAEFYMALEGFVSEARFKVELEERNKSSKD